MGDNLEIADWISYSLPKDAVSINSAIIVAKTLQNPMMIDPQLQASRWIKNMLKQSELVHLKMGSDTFIKLLESALRMRNPIIIECS
jgi:dynein heavy chain